jgi:uncharacterized repeat protein (TIGR02059 family)
VTLTFGEALADGASALPLASSFTVTNPGTPSYPVTVTGVAVSGNTVVLTLNNPVGAGRAATFTYTAPSVVSGTANAALQDVTGNDSPSITGFVLTNNSTIDLKLPLLITASPHQPRVDSSGLTLVLKYDEVLNQLAAAPGAFTVRVGSQTVMVDSVETVDDTVVLTMAERIGIGQVVTVAYAAPSTPDATATNEATQDLRGNDAVSFSATAVVNGSTQDVTPPALVTAAPRQPSLDATGRSLTLTFSEPLATATAVAGDFEVLVDGLEEVVDTVTVSGDTVVLAFQTVIEGNLPVTVSYMAPPADSAPTNNAIQDTSGNDSLAFSGVNVVNNSTTDTRPPVLRTLSPNQPVVSANGLSLTLTYSEALNSTSAVPSDFEVIVNGVTRSVTTVVASGSTVVLTLATPVGQGQTVTASYTAPGADSSDTNSAIQDATGNDAVSFSTVTVTNNSTVDQTSPVF